MANASFSYQWRADDSDTAGATGPTCTLADVGESRRGQDHRGAGEFHRRRGQCGDSDSAATGAVAGAPADSPPATLENPPTGHNGTDALTFEIRFSEEFKLIYKTLRDHAFTVTGGTVAKARRLEPPGNVRWEITISPESNADVTVVLPITTDCDDRAAICAEDGRNLSNRLSLTVSGPSG